MDEPASVDNFGAHTRLASAITRLVADDPEIKIIGILGPWGSGKSTVVRAIEQQLRAQSKDMHFFTYDAWLHQSDPVLLTDQAHKKATNALAEQIASGGYVGNLLTVLKEGERDLLNATALKPDALIRTVIVPLLDARPGRRWVESRIADLLPRVRKASRDAVAGLRSEIDRLARSASRWKQQDAARLRSALDLK